MLNYLMPDSKLFLYIYSASVLPGMVPWFLAGVQPIPIQKALG
ncbi:hypothetical protein Q0F98_21815 [Paenibacillus amylolyticus]|nr:hypothetical protein Q0F98_21815 [Paenibacillus amylolyticus]